MYVTDVLWSLVMPFSESFLNAKNEMYRITKETTYVEIVIKIYIFLKTRGLQVKKPCSRPAWFISTFSSSFSGIVYALWGPDSP